MPSEQPVDQIETSEHIDETVQLSKSYLKDLVDEIIEQYEPYSFTDELRSEALKTLFYLSNEPS